MHGSHMYATDTLQVPNKKNMHLWNQKQCVLYKYIEAVKIREIRKQMMLTDALYSQEFIIPLRHTFGQTCTFGHHFLAVISLFKRKKNEFHIVLQYILERHHAWVRCINIRNEAKRHYLF